MAATPRTLPGRTTRGRRMQTLVGEEADADDDFWGQGAFQEDEADSDFDSGGEQAAEQPDEVDSDFDADEAPDPATKAQDPDALARRDERASAARSSKRRKRYVDPALARSRKPPPIPASSPNKRRRSGPEPVDLNVDKGSLRRSTKMASASSEKVRVQRAAEDEERKKAREISLAKKVVERPLTQEELLQETKETEKRNVVALQQLLKLEEEKKGVAPKKVSQAGPTMRFRSWGGKQTISFSSKRDVPMLYRPQKAKSIDNPKPNVSKASSSIQKQVGPRGPHRTQPADLSPSTASLPQETVGSDVTTNQTLVTAKTANAASTSPHQQRSAVISPPRPAAPQSAKGYCTKPHSTARDAVRKPDAVAATRSNDTVPEPVVADELTKKTESQQIEGAIGRKAVCPVATNELAKKVNGVDIQQPEDLVVVDRISKETPTTLRGPESEIPQLEKALGADEESKEMRSPKVTRATAGLSKSIAAAVETTKGSQLSEGTRAVGQQSDSVVTGHEVASELRPLGADGLGDAAARRVDKTMGADELAMESRPPADTAMAILPQESTVTANEEEKIRCPRNATGAEKLKMLSGNAEAGSDIGKEKTLRGDVPCQPDRATSVDGNATEKSREGVAQLRTISGGADDDKESADTVLALPKEISGKNGTKAID